MHLGSIDLDEARIGWVGYYSVVGIVVGGQGLVLSI